MIAVRDAELDEPSHAAAIVAIVDSYARGPGGQGAPLSADARSRMIDGLRANPHQFALLAFDGSTPVGVAVCFWGFSTFAGRPFLNVHDLAVLPEHQGRGIGRALLDEAERRARERDACKLTLEVHESNHGARRLYARFGFGPWDAPTYFVSKRL